MSSNRKAAAALKEYASDRDQPAQQERYCLRYLWADGPVEPYRRCLGDWRAADAEQEGSPEFPLCLIAFKCELNTSHCNVLKTANVL